MKLRDVALVATLLVGLGGCGSQAAPAAVAPSTVSVVQTVTEQPSPSATPSSMSVRDTREAYEAICENESACSTLALIGRGTSCANMNDCSLMVENSRRLLTAVVDGLDEAGLDQADAAIDAAIDDHQDALAEWDAADCTAKATGVTGQAPSGLAVCAAATTGIRKGAGEVAQALTAVA